MAENPGILSGTLSGTPKADCQILLIEDAPRLSALIQECLQQQGMVVAIEHRGDLVCQRIFAGRMTMY